MPSWTRPLALYGAQKISAGIANTVACLFDIQRDYSMGLFRIAVQVANLDNDAEGMRVEAIVDTGAFHSTFPASLLDRIGIEPNERPMRVQIGSGEIDSWRVGTAMISIAGWGSHPCPVIFGRSEDIFLLGATTLKIFGLVADTTNRELIPVVLKARPF